MAAAGDWRGVAPFAARDGLVLAATAALWWFVIDAGDAGTWRAALNVLVALLTAGCGYLVHEWGHLLGCWARRSHVRMPTAITSVFLFNFDLGRNDRRQFNAMAAGGFIASIAFLALVSAAAPLHLLAGKLAAALVAIGVAATLIFEVPTAWRVFRGGALPRQGLAFVPRMGDPEKTPEKT